MSAQQQVEQLFSEFQAMHPNSKEVFNPTFENIRRWRWSIEEAQKRQERKVQSFNVPDDRSAKAIAKSRAIKTFKSFSRSTQDKFLTLASLFPGRVIYATGSRVSGEYIERDSPESIKKMRSDLLKKVVDVSDYDITMDFEKKDNLEEFKNRLPSWGDLVLNVPNGERKIKIPMWDFSKIPKNRMNEVFDLIQNKSWGKLMDIHNELNLSPQILCCNQKVAERWFTWAVENKLIQRT